MTPLLRIIAVLLIGLSIMVAGLVRLSQSYDVRLPQAAVQPTEQRV